MQIYKRTHTRKKIIVSVCGVTLKETDTIQHHILLYTPAYFIRNEYDIRQWGGPFAPSIVSPVSFQSFRIPDTYHFYSNNRSPHRRNHLQVIPGVAVEKSPNFLLRSCFCLGLIPKPDRHCPYLRQFFGRFRKGVGVR